MRSAIIDLQASRIREVANAAMGREGVLAFWFGESDAPTPPAVMQAANQSLAAGETFYTHNLGLRELREAVAAYASRLHGEVSQDRIAITSGGVQGLMLASQALVEAGDEVVVITPVWPNLVAQPQIAGARVQCVPLVVSEHGAWVLDMSALIAAINDKTKLLVVNSPNNPTGWTLTRQEQEQILSHCRSTGTWILSDEVYERLYYLPSNNGCAPSFLDIASPKDRVIAIQSFSKSFLMTGWRLGWMVMPEGMQEHMGKLIEFNTSCSSVFVQRAGLAALDHADAITPPLVEHLQRCRNVLLPALSVLPGVQVAMPDGGMYAFFRIAGQEDCLQVAKRLVAEAGLGLAPGSAFAPQASGWLRWCFASQDTARLEEGAQRLKKWLAL